ncbi:MAG TPA: hypothetical protein DCE23_01100, partial [Firmicutes bacterium]|nr:hypothetical protein [Bacillota bacterium]
MKKVIYIIVLFSIFICNVKAFHVDIDKIDIGSKSNKLIKKLDDSYAIDTSGFDNEEEKIDGNLSSTIEDLVRISLDNGNKEEKKKYFNNYQYYSSEGGETLATSLFIDLYLDKLMEIELKASHIREIKTSHFNDNDVIAFAYLDDAKVKDIDDDVILVFWLKKDNQDYRLFYPWLTLGEDIDTYFKRISLNEEQGDIIGGSFKELSLNGDKKEVSLEQLNKVYNGTYNSVVQLTGMNNNGTSMYGSGFYLREGVVVTTWSLFTRFLTDSNYIYVNDASGKTYQVKGIIAAATDYDIVVLKISDNVGQGVIIGDSSTLKTDDSLFIVNSQNNGGFSIKYGKYVSEKNGRLKNMFLLNSSDVGAALFDHNGKVIGIASGDKVNSELSYANSINYLSRLQMILNSQTYDKISYTILDTFKQSYYTKIGEERVYNYIDSKIWDKYKNIGKIEDNIKLDLIKAN